MGTLVLVLLAPQAVWARAAGLNEVVHAADRARGHGHPAVVAMDLDETTVDSTPRRWAAYRHTAEILCNTGALSGQICEAVSSLNLSEIYHLPNSYDGDALAVRLGLDPRSSSWQLLAKQTIGEYLSGRYEGWDQPVAGANAYVRELRAKGVRVYFVSSRSDDAQRASTLSSLHSLGMLTSQDEENDVILRPRSMTSIEFKRWAFSRIVSEAKAANAEIVGAFENEPENIQAMKEIFPGAQLIFVNGAWIKDGQVPVEAERIQDYR
jgi:hypothetical protein